MSIDRLSNMISSLKNASMAGKFVVEISYTKQCEEVAKVLKAKGFLSEIKLFKPEKTNVKMLHLGLTNDNGVCSFSEAFRISKPGRRIYRGKNELKNVRGIYGVVVVSTSKGIMDSTTAKKKNLGGEVLCEVY